MYYSTWPPSNVNRFSIKFIQISHIFAAFLMNYFEILMELFTFSAPKKRIHTTRKIKYLNCWNFFDTKQFNTKTYCFWHTKKRKHSSDMNSRPAISEWIWVSLLYFSKLHEYRLNESSRTVYLSKAKALSTNVRRLSIYKPKFLSIWIELIWLRMLLSMPVITKLFELIANVFFFTQPQPFSLSQSMMYVAEYMVLAFFSDCSTNHEIAIKSWIYRKRNRDRETERHREKNKPRREMGRAKEQKPFCQRQISSNYICDQSTTVATWIYFAIKCIVQVASATSDN